MRSRDPLRVFIVMAFASHVFFGAYSVMTSVYRFRTAGLDPLELVLVGTVLEGTIFLFETPTGVVADAYGRKRSIVIGHLIVGAGFMLEGVSTAFGAILAAQIVWGIGYTFTSGATEAWITGEVGGERAQHAFMRGAQASGAGMLAGTICGGIVAAAGTHVPLLAGGAGTVVLGLWLAVAMPETAFVRPRAGEASAIALVRSGVRAVRGRRVIVALLAVAVFAGLSSEGFDRLWEAHLLSAFRLPALGPLPDVSWFGVISAAGIVLGIGGVEVARRLLAGASERAGALALIGLGGARIGAGLVFAFAAAMPLAMGALLVRGTLSAAAAPVYRAWLARRADPRLRATVISMAGQLDAAGQIAGGPPLGAVARLGSIRVALACAALLFAPALALLARAAKATGRELEAPDESGRRPVAPDPSAIATP